MTGITESQHSWTLPEVMDVAEYNGGRLTGDEESGLNVKLNSCSILSHIHSHIHNTHNCAARSRRLIFSATKCVLDVQGHSGSQKVSDFGTNLKCTYDFLSVNNSNYSPTLHRFRDTATYWLKIAHFSHPSLIWRPRSLGSLWNFVLRLSTRKLRVMGLSSVKIT